MKLSRIIIDAMVENEQNRQRATRNATCSNEDLIPYDNRAYLKLVSRMRQTLKKSLPKNTN